MSKAKAEEKSLALEMRRDGKSYSQIKQKLGVSKSSLSIWLREYPLSAERINELRAKNPQRIERFRNTMATKRNRAFEGVYQIIKKDFGTLSKRDLTLGGVFLYWGEGSKSAPYTTALSNTDPQMLKFFIRWLSLFGVGKRDLKVSLHLYKDMDIEKEITYWSEELALPRECFKRPYIKDSKLTGLTYKNGFGHGTCNVRYFDKRVWQYSSMALKYIRGNSI